ncbi:MAG: hypothetical protein AAB343_03165 [Patescibacteria group bacterium]
MYTPIVTTALGALHFADIANQPETHQISCKCTKEEALRYAITASRSIGFEPQNMTDSGFGTHKMGIPSITSGTGLTVAVQATQQNTTEVYVRIKTGIGKSSDREKFLQTFLDAAGKRAKVFTPEPTPHKKEKSV